MRALVNSISEVGLPKGWQCMCVCNFTPCPLNSPLKFVGVVTKYFCFCIFPWRELPYVICFGFAFGIFFFFLLYFLCFVVQGYIGRGNRTESLSEKKAEFLFVLVWGRGDEEGDGGDPDPSPHTHTPPSLSPWPLNPNPSLHTLWHLTPPYKVPYTLWHLTLHTLNTPHDKDFSCIKHWPLLTPWPMSPIPQLSLLKHSSPFLPPSLPNPYILLPDFHI